MCAKIPTDLLFPSASCSMGMGQRGIEDTEIQWDWGKKIKQWVIVFGRWEKKKCFAPRDSIRSGISLNWELQRSFCMEGVFNARTGRAHGSVAPCTWELCSVQEPWVAWLLAWAVSSNAVKRNEGRRGAGVCSRSRNMAQNLQAEAPTAPAPVWVSCMMPLRLSLLWPGFAECIHACGQLFRAFFRWCIVISEQLFCEKSCTWILWLKCLFLYFLLLQY